MSSLSGFAGQIALVLLSLYRQEQQQHASSVEGMRLLLRGLRHEAIGKISDLLLEQMRTATSAAEILKLRSGWVHLVEFLNSYIDNLRWVSEPPKPEGLQLAVEDVNVNGLIDRAILLADILQKNPVCQNNIPPGIEFKADSRLLLLLFFNLLQNGKKFTPHHAKKFPVIVSCHRSQTQSGDRLTFFIDDSGTGISDDLAERLFVETGVHQNPPGRIISGSGFGLFLCNKIVAAHGGAMLRPSRSSRGGALMSFYLPA